MVATLRKYHQRTWVLMTMIIPVFIFTALLFRPELPALDIDDNNGVAIHLLSSDRDFHTIHISLNKPFDKPSAKIYQISGTERKFIGSLGAHRSYTYKIIRGSENPDAIHLLIYDTIHQKELGNYTVRVNQ